jgi:hypothetical protein
VGRDPDEIERSTLQTVRLLDDGSGGPGDTTDQVVDRFGELWDAGAEHVILNLRDVWRIEPLERLGRDVIPQLRGL